MHEQPQYRALRRHPAMTVDLDDVLPGVRMRSPHHSQQNLIDIVPIARIEHMTVK